MKQPFQETQQTTVPQTDILIQVEHLTLLFIVLVPFLASFGPAFRASRVRISEILRYE